jgi:hypothetical protein
MASINSSLLLRSMSATHKGKGKVLRRTGHEGPKGEKRYSSTLSLTPALDGGGWSTPRPGRFTPRKDTRCPLYRRLCGPQGRSGRVRKISPPTGTRSPDRPARSESLYRLSYPSQHVSDPYKIKMYNRYRGFLGWGGGGYSGRGVVQDHPPTSSAEVALVQAVPPPSLCACIGMSLG